MLPWLEHPALESDRLAPERLDLLDRPLQQLLPAGVQPHRPWDRLMQYATIQTRDTRTKLRRDLVT